MENLGLSIIFLFMFIGLAGTILPIIPGVVITALAAFIYAWMTDFAVISLPLALLFVLIAIIATTADTWMPMLGAKQTGASIKSIIFGTIGSIIGFFLGSFVPVIGNLIGAIAGYIIGIVIAEYLRLKDWNLALHAGIGGLIGWGLATVVRFGSALIIILIFAGFIWFQ
jgi:uncharacterized protein